MKPWRALAVLASALTLFALLPAGAGGAQSSSFFIASDSYYRLDVPAGTITTRVEATVQSASSGELDQVELWAMPGARDIVVRRGDVELAITTTVAPIEGSPTLVTATLDRPIKGQLKADLVMTYTVPPQSTAVVKADAGAIEAKFISQGPGSFVFIDVPADSDNFVEPGCLEVAQQPAEVRESGFLRFVCGETLILAIRGDADDVVERCANLSDSCRQRLVLSPYIGFAQAITDPARQHVLRADIELAGGTKTLSLRYFHTDRAWADAQFETARQALPLLEELFGFPYPYEQVLLRQSNLILEVGIAGLAFTDRGEVLVTNTHGLLDDREVTIHELAHQWAGLNLEEPFAWEGLADWANHIISPQLGIATYDRPWESLGYADPLATWGVTSAVGDPDYWYGRSAAFWFAYEQAIGGRANMTAVLGKLDDIPKARDFDAQWFQDRGEEISGANLDELFLSWVYVRETAAPILAERRAAHDSVRPLRERAASMDLSGVPADIQANLDQWAFHRIADQVAEANLLLDQYAALLARAAGVGGVGAGLGPRWNEMTSSQVRQVLDQMAQALDAMEASAARLSDGVDDPAGRDALEQARQRFLAGDFVQAKILAAGASSISYNKDVAARLIEVAREREATFSPNFLQKIGLYFSDPSADVDAAETAFANGDYEAAIARATAAIDTWNGAQEQGLFRLSLVAFVMFGVAGGGWLLMRRLDAKRAKQAPTPRREGHVLPEPTERASAWQEWLNQKDSNSGP